MCEKHLKKKEILRKRPASLLKIPLWDSSHPANISWCSRRLQDMSGRSLQYVFIVTIYCLPSPL